jgi:hypothetical protein
MPNLVSAAIVLVERARAAMRKGLHVEYGIAADGRLVPIDGWGRRVRHGRW